jgi:hypothetical protein
MNEVIDAIPIVCGLVYGQASASAYMEYVDGSRASMLSAIPFTICLTYPIFPHRTACPLPVTVFSVFRRRELE